MLLLVEWKLFFWVEIIAEADGVHVFSVLVF